MSADCLTEHCIQIHKWGRFPCTYDYCKYEAYSQKCFKKGFIILIQKTHNMTIYNFIARKLKYRNIFLFTRPKQKARLLIIHVIVEIVKKGLKIDTILQFTSGYMIIF